MTMTSIHTHLRPALDRLAERRRQFRERQMRQYGFAPDCRCYECGDTGYDPDPPRRPCRSCDAGREIHRRARREADWQGICWPRFAAYRLDTHPNRQAAARVASWLHDGAGDGVNLLLSGPVGTGKTALATAAVRELFVAGRTVHMGSVPDLLDANRPRDDGDRARDAESRIVNLQRVQALLLDDLGAEKPSDWQREQLYRVINGRYERGLPTIVTTNIGGLLTHLGPATVSRLGESVEKVAVTGDDLRRSARIGGAA